MKLNFVTSNEGKFRSFKNVASSLDYDFERRELDYPENHDSNSTLKIAEDGARYCCKKLGEPAVVTDAGLFINTLNSFPGVNTGFALKTLGNRRILKLLEGEEKREAVFRLSIASYSQEKGLISLTEETRGKITRELRGGKGFGFDPIFLPKGYENTFAERPELRDREGPLKPATQELVERLQN